MFFMIAGSMAYHWSSILMMDINSLAAASASEAGDWACAGGSRHTSCASMPPIRKTGLDMKYFPFKKGRAPRRHCIRRQAAVTDKRDNSGMPFPLPGPRAATHNQRQQ
jgi:hypothetical protein